MKIELSVDNLKCYGCANTISKALKKLIGVTMVEVIVEDSMVVVEHNNLGKEAEIKSKLAELGYPEQGTTTAFQKAKSYASCAIGRF